MIYRDISSLILEQSKLYPVITLLGPRQSGKTTLVRSLFNHLPYRNLESPETRALAEADPKKFLSESPQGLVIDEIQRLPSLLSYIQVLVDERQTVGQFILTGSHQLTLHQSITQSLAGRTAILTLLPLGNSELQKANIQQTLLSQMLKGGYPRLYDKGISPSRAYADYLQTYVERDVRLMVNIGNLQLFQRFIKLCAGRVGQLLNLSSLCADVGISVPTAKQWISILEASYIIKLLPPYFENFGKRYIKTPKLYFIDTGFLCYVLDIETEEQLDRDPLRGQIFENFVFSELLKIRFNQGKAANLYFFRDSHGNEVDFLFKSANQFNVIEAKSSQTFNIDFLKGITYFKNLAPGRVSKSFLIYSGNEATMVQNVQLLNAQSISLSLLSDE